MTVHEMCNKLERLKAEFITASRGDFDSDLKEINWRTMDFIKDLATEIVEGIEEIYQ